MNESLEIKNKTKEILLRKLNQIIALTGINGLELPVTWFYTSIPNGTDNVNKLKFRIIDPVRINKSFFEDYLKEHHIGFKISKNGKSYYFYLTNK